MIATEGRFPFTMKSVMRLLLIHQLFLVLLLTGCQQTYPDMPSELLIFSKEWGKPRAKLTIGEISIWRYLTHNIENIIFLRQERVLGQIKCGTQEKMWEVTQRWVNYVRNHPEYQRHLKNYISDIIDHKLRHGMTREEICLSWGNPISISTSLQPSMLKEEWVYHKEPYQKTILTFQDGILSNWRIEAE